MSTATERIWDLISGRTQPTPIEKDEELRRVREIVETMRARIGAAERGFYGRGYFDTLTHFERKLAQLESRAAA